MNTDKKITLMAALIAGAMPTESMGPLHNNKIVYLIANPRAAMVCFLRMIGERGDFKVMHIPANWAYCHAHNYIDITAGWYREDAPATYVRAKEDILKEAEKTHVFVGENTHAAKDFLEANSEFIKDPRVKLVFLVSDPHGAIISYYKKKEDYFDKMPISQLSDSMGLNFLDELCQEVTQAGAHPPLIIKSSDLYFKTHETINKVCMYLEIPFLEESLYWPDVSENFSNFSDYGWYTIEQTECAKHWHADAIKSTGFCKLEEFATDVQGRPTFEEVANLRHREICIQAYNDNLVYYKRLVALCN